MSDFNPACSDSSEKMTREIGNWRVRLLRNDDDAKPDKVAVTRRSVYRSGIPNDGVKGVSSGQKQNKGS